ncbi:ribosomal protein S18 acetylase RimI-like enzyme [Arthrobacter sp. PvP023]|uniref:GNAT family N-acetyltransferase n=1 Tax=Micrococcaceae TaxID=1268 RepID=UPI001AEAF6C0|nr:GNAT family N-acetyltransferase [Arthrobacter sp. PvP023]MBP1136052.1 ribosomal protein S18 acetylase RimI-like enzyme [Arthrobacter sp. PvP023]
MARIALSDIESAMDAAWPAPDREESGGWVLRAAGGVTQRANSVWPRSEPSGTRHDRVAWLRDARAWYRSRRLPVIFQVFDDSRSTALNAVLDEEGFTRQSETLVLVRDAGAEPASADEAPDGGVELSAEPSAEWLRLWWSVDGRGGEESLATARGILEGCRSLYALVRDDNGVPAAVGRLAVPSGSEGGLYAMATRPDARRRGYASRVLRTLLREGDARGLSGYWLLVTAANAGARELYARSGFTEAGRYYYRQERPKRHLTGC